MTTKSVLFRIDCRKVRDSFRETGEGSYCNLNEIMIMAWSFIGVEELLGKVWKYFESGTCGIYICHESKTPEMTQQV